MVSIELRDLKIAYSVHSGRVRVIEGLNAEVPARSIVSVVGRNGSGKTTLLRAIAGLKKVEAGTIAFSPPAPVLGWVPQDFRNALYPWWSVERNIFLTREPVEARARGLVQESLAAIGVTPAQAPHRLSGGQQQVIVFLRAVMRPNVQLLLLDEPFSALDIEHRVQLRNILREEATDRGLTVLFVSHDLLDAATISDRVIVLRDGRVARTLLPKGVAAGAIDSGEAEGCPSNLVQVVREVERELLST